MATKLGLNVQTFEAGKGSQVEITRYMFPGELGHFFFLNACKHIFCKKT